MKQSPIPTLSLSREVRREYRQHPKGKDAKDRAIIAVLKRRLGGTFTPEIYNAVSRRAFHKKATN